MLVHIGIGNGIVGRISPATLQMDGDVGESGAPLPSPETSAARERRNPCTSRRSQYDSIGGRSLDIAR